jgi:hypothetical protein
MKGAIVVTSPIGPTIFLPNSFAGEIRNMKELSFSRSIVKVRYATQLMNTTDFVLVKNALAREPGLNPILAIDYHGVMQEVARLDLTRSLGMKYRFQTAYLTAHINRFRH